MADTAKSFPIIPVSHWYALRNQFKKSIPGTISLSYLAAILGQAEETVKRNVFPSLKQIGLIDAEGKINQEFAKQFRDDALYPSFCKQILNSVYPEEVRDIFPDKNANREQIKTWFMNHTGNGDSVSGKITAFYYALLEVDTTQSNGNNKKQKESKENISKPKPTKNNYTASNQVNPVEPATSEKLNQQPNNSQTAKAPDLNINIQIHISSDASPDRIKSIFEHGQSIYINMRMNE